jgi:hypothetical protein
MGYYDDEDDNEPQIVINYTPEQWQAKVEADRESAIASSKNEMFWGLIIAGVVFMIIFFAGIFGAFG